MKKFYRNLTVLSLVIAMLACQCSYASILDDIKNFFGFGASSTQETSESAKVTVPISEGTLAHISSDAYSKLLDEQKEVYFVTEQIYEALINIDIDGLHSHMNEHIADEITNSIKEYLAENSGHLTVLKNIAAYLEYNVVSMTNSGDKIIVKVNYKFPNLHDIALKILPSILLTHTGALLNGEVDKDTITAIIDKFGDAAPSVEKESFTYDFSFIKVNGEWKLTDVDKISLKLEEYFKSLLS